MPNNDVVTALGTHFDAELVGGKNRQAVVLTTCSSGGETPNHYVLTNTNNARTIKASPGQIYHLVMSNKAGYEFVVKLYDKASNPVPASDVPVAAFGVQAGVTLPLSFDNGLEFTVGIAMLVVLAGAFANTDNGSITAAGDGIIFTGFK